MQLALLSPAVPVVPMMPVMPTMVPAPPYVFDLRLIFIGHDGRLNGWSSLVQTRWGRIGEAGQTGGCADDRTRG